MNEDRLLFLLSMPRSGSTYLQRLLSNNEAVHTTSEPWVMLNFAQFIKPSLVSATFNADLAHQALEEYLERFPEFDFPDKLKALMLDVYSPMAGVDGYVLDKTPRYWELYQELRTLFPRARFICLLRNPVVVAKSMIKTWHLKNLFEINNYRRDLLMAPKLLDQLDAKAAEDLQLYSLHYENLVEDTEGQLSKLLGWLGLNYSSDYLEVDANQKAKGSFGDPFQNQETQQAYSAQEAANFQLTDFHQEFLSGYTHHLSQLGLKQYGPNAFPRAKETEVFTAFLKMGQNHLEHNKDKLTMGRLVDENLALKHTLAETRNSASYRLGASLLKPFKGLRKIFGKR